jgi:hypothetical protein
MSREHAESFTSEEILILAHPHAGIWRARVIDEILTKLRTHAAGCT